MGIFDKWNKSKKTQLAETPVKRDIPKPILNRPTPVTATHGGFTTFTGATPTIAENAGSLDGFSLSDFPPGMGNMPTLPTRDGRADPFCDMCGTASEHRYIDPIPVIATNPKNGEDRWFWNRALCAGCYSIRFEARYPGVAPFEVPD